MKNLAGTTYPLTAAQNILFYSQKFTLHKQVNNIFTLITLEQELDFQVLQRAIELAYEQNDALHIRLAKVRGEFRQFFYPGESPRIGFLDFLCKKRDAMERKLYRLASKPFYLQNRPMSRIWMIRTADGMSGIYFGVSHIVLDSWGICVLMKHVMDLYAALKCGNPMPKPLYPHEPLLIADVGYRDTPQYRKDLEFWKRECMCEEPWYTHVNGPEVLEAYRRKKRNNQLQGSPSFSLRTKALHETIIIPREDVLVMEAFCREHALPMQTLFLFGVRTCLSKRNRRQKDVSINATVARRSTLQERFSGGTLVHAFPFRTVIEESCTFLDAVGQVHGRQSLLYRHAGIDYLEILKLIQDAYFNGDPMPSHQAVCLTFQPVALTLGEGAACHTKWYCNGVSSQPFYLTIMDDDGSGGLRCYYEYQRSVVKRQTVLDFHANMVKVILAGISNRDVTVGELLDL